MSGGKNHMNKPSPLRVDGLETIYTKPIISSWSLAHMFIYKGHFFTQNF